MASEPDRFDGELLCRFLKDEQDIEDALDVFQQLEWVTAVVDGGVPVADEFVHCGFGGIAGEFRGAFGIGFDFSQEAVGMAGAI